MMQYPSNSPRRGGCLLYGCLISTLLTIALSVGIGFYLYRSIQSAVVAYTADTEIPVEVPPVDAASVGKARDEFQRLLAVLRDPSASGTFMFTVAELNGLINSSSVPDFLKGRVALKEEQGELSATFSIQLGDIARWPALAFLARGKEDRYVNGYARGTIQDAGGETRVTLSKLELSGQDLGELGSGEASSWLTGWLNSELRSGDSSIDSRLSRLASISAIRGELRFSIRPAPVRGETYGQR